jgi:P27 family predicted phage terminase small subunit
MGRTAAPAALRLIGGRSEGRDSGGRKVEPPPAFRRIPPTPPDWLRDEARAEWDRVVPGLARLDLLKEEDHAALAVYCETWATFVEAQADIRATGLTVENVTYHANGGESSRKVVKNPSVTIAEAASTQLRGWAAHFGLTPSAEGKLGGLNKGPDDDEPNPFA